jgi:hypothetical protein
MDGNLRMPPSPRDTTATIFWELIGNRLPAASIKGGGGDRSNDPGCRRYPSSRKMAR